MAARTRVSNARGFVPRTERERLYGGAAVVACPSRREGFGVTCLEAMAYGKPVVASAVGGLRDLWSTARQAFSCRRAIPRPPRGASHFSWDGVIDRTVAAYGDASGTMAALESKL